MNAVRFRVVSVLAALAAVLLCAPSMAQAQALDTLQIRPNVWVIFGAGGNVTARDSRLGVHERVIASAEL